MKKNLLLTTAIVAAALCFADTAKAERIKHLGPTVDPIVIEGEVTGNAAADTASACGNGAEDQATTVDQLDDANRGGAFVGAAPGEGGLVVNVAAEANIHDNTAPNAAGVAGAIVNFHGNTLNVGNDVTFEDNSAGDAGGAIWSEGWKTGDLKTTLTIGNGVSFIDNTATGDMGGAVGIMAWQDATFGDDVTFEGNSAGKRGGAVAFQSANWGTTNDGPVAASFGTDAYFADNSAGDGGAVWNLSRDEAGISDGSVVTFGAGATFEENVATGENGKEGLGGAVYNEYRGETENPTATITFGDGAEFTDNRAKTAGGAIYNKKGIVTFNGGVTFSGNGIDFNGDDEVDEHGLNDIHNEAGVINFNGNTTLDGGITGDGTVNFAAGTTLTASATEDGTTFGSNTVTFAGNNTLSGNINSLGTIDFDGAVTLNGNIDTTAAINFNGNTTLNGNVTGLGAVDFAEGTTLTAKADGTSFGNRAVTFAGNNTIKNVINSTGTVDFNGDVTLDKGIAGDGTITFADGAALNATLQTTFIEAFAVNFAGHNTLNLTVANGLANADYDFIDADTLNGVNNVTIADNAIYNLALTDEGKISVGVKSAQQIIQTIDVPVAAQEAETLTAVISTNGNGTGVANAIADRIAASMQGGNAAAAVQAVKELAPTTSQQVVGVAQGVNNMLSSVTGGRMAAVSGRAGGDAFIGGSLWAQALANHTKQSETSESSGFEANSAGVAMGIDGKANDALTIGFGYGFTSTDADSVGRNVDVDGHNFFVYGSYQPSAFYIDTMLSYGISEYTEKKAPMGIAMTAKYHVHTFAANMTAGYGFNNGITPEGGLRYMAVSQETYNDGAQNISSDNSNVLTAVLGAKYEHDLQVENYKIKPNLRLAATYDLVSDNSKANIDIIGGGNYQIVGKRLSRLGGEIGAGVTTTTGKWDLSLEYNGGFRKDYQSHTGLIKAQYNF